MRATNFDELVLPMAEEAPHAVVLDWYRRLEMTIRSYLASRGANFRNGPDAEQVIAADPLLGAATAEAIAELRTVRNRIAHAWEPFASADSVMFARKALVLIGQIMRAQDAPAT
jgi:hypothetical protein